MKNWIAHLRRILIPSSVMALPLSFMAFAAPAALAATYNQYCNSVGVCINQYGGGPNVESSGMNHDNNAFNITRDVARCNDGLTTSSCPIAGNPANLPIVYVEDVNPSSPYESDCLGDYGDSSSDAAAGVNDECDTSSPNGGWGTVFVEGDGATGGCPSGTFALYDAHWSSSWSQRAGIYWAAGANHQVYLNTLSPYCLTRSSFSG